METKEVAKTELKENLSFNEMMALADVFAKSGMFEDAKDQEKAFVKIMAGKEIGIPAFASISGVSIIKGKTSIGAGLMASAVDASGIYSYEVVTMDEKICSLDFYKNGKKKGNSTFTIEDAKKANTGNMEKFPRNMLFARAMSNGTKWYCPGVFSGPVYTPEELQTIDITHEDVTIKPEPEPEPEKSTIEHYAHGINSLRKCETMAEIVEAWKRMTAEVQAHPSVEDERNSKIKELIEAAKTIEELKSIWKTKTDGKIVSKEDKMLPTIEEWKNAKKSELEKIK